MVVFSRSLSEPLGKLVRGLDEAGDKKTRPYGAWVTFLSDDQPTLDPKVVQWGQQHGIRHVPLGIFEDAAGPTSYRLARDADVTVLLFTKQKVTANFAFRSGELTEAKVAEILKAVPGILK